VRFCTENGRFAFLSHHLEDLGPATYDDHLRLIGKRLVDFALVLIEFFSLDVTAEALRANICSKSARPLCLVLVTKLNIAYLTVLPAVLHTNLLNMRKQVSRTATLRF